MDEVITRAQSRKYQGTLSLHDLLAASLILPRWKPQTWRLAPKSDVDPVPASRSPAVSPEHVRHPVLTIKSMTTPIAVHSAAVALVRRSKTLSSFFMNLKARQNLGLPKLNTSLSTYLEVSPNDLSTLALSNGTILY